MKVIKRDGSTVSYDRSKIAVAIQKANKEVEACEKVSDEKIEEIIESIEEKGRSRILVEDIQDIIEQKLMEDEKFLLAKKYIIYRYQRELVRKANTTDDSILSLIQNRIRRSSHRAWELIAMTWQNITFCLTCIFCNHLSEIAP